MCSPSSSPKADSIFHNVESRPAFGPWTSTISCRRPTGNVFEWIYLGRVQTALVVGNRTDVNFQRCSTP